MGATSAAELTGPGRSGPGGLNPIRPRQTLCSESCKTGMKKVPEYTNREQSSQRQHFLNWGPLGPLLLHFYVDTKPEKLLLGLCEGPILFRRNRGC